MLSLMIQYLQNGIKTIPQQRPQGNNTKQDFL